MRASTFARFAALAALLVHGSPGQADPERVLVAAAMPSPPATVVYELDPATGVHVALSRFPSDVLPPLAIAVDPANREPGLALADAGGSRIVRLHVRGRQVLGERVLAQLPGNATGMCVPSIGDVLVATEGAGGGIWRVGRQSGAVASFWPAPGISTLSEPVILPGKVWAAQDLSPAAPTLVAFLDSMPGAPAYGPAPLSALPGVRVTGIHEFVAGRRRQVFTDALGTVYEWSQPGSSPAPVPLQTPLPPGGAVALHGGDGGDAWVLGGIADPTLKAFPLVSAQVSRPVTVLGGPFAGDPVDFARTGPAAAIAVPFGAPCANPAGGVAGTNGPPQLGSSGFAVELAQGVPSALALLALGTSDSRSGGAPLPLPIGSCELLVSLDAVLLALTGPSGVASRNVPIPASPQLAGAVFYAQWFQDPFGPRGSDALALQLF